MDLCKKQILQGKPPEKRILTAPWVSTLPPTSTMSGGMSSSVDAEILAAADQTISLKECAFLADKGYDAKSIYNTIKAVYEGGAFIPLHPRGTKDSKTLSAGNPVCAAGLAMHKDGKTTDNNRTRQKYRYPFRQSKTGVCPCCHKNWNNGKKNRGCCGVYRAMVFAPLRCPKLFLFPFACLCAAPSACFAHLLGKERKL